MVTVIVCSLLALFAAEIASWMYVLCSDPDWQADAAWYGIPVARMAWESICMPDNWGIILPNMLMGMVIGSAGHILRPAEGYSLYGAGAGGPACPAR